jgi:hypothetical protein
MNLKIKNEWIDAGIYCPIRKVEIKVRMIEKELYHYYYKNGYDFLFDVQISVKQPIKQTKPIDNDLFN